MKPRNIIVTVRRANLLGDFERVVATVDDDEQGRIRTLTFPAPLTLRSGDTLEVPTLKAPT